MAKGVVIGLLLGLGLGWLLFDREPETVSETVVVDVSQHDPRPELESTPAATGSPDAEESTLDDAEVLASVENDDWIDMKGKVGTADVYTDAVVDALVRRAKAAFDAGKRAEFLTCLELLVEADHPHGLAYLVTLVPLVPPQWPEQFEVQGTFFVRAFMGHDVPGLAAAVRERIEARAQTGRGLSDGWRRLLLQHGSDADVAWLIELEPSPARVIDVAMSEDLEIAERYLDFAVAEAREGRRYDAAHLVGAVHSFAAAHPKEGFVILAEALRSGELLGVPYADGTGHTLGVALAETVGWVGVERIEAALLATPDATRRIRATWGIVARLPKDSPLITESAEVLQQAVADGNVDPTNPTFGAAVGVINRTGYPLSEDAVAAVEAFAERTTGREAGFYRDSARRLRAKLNQRWK